LLRHVADLAGGAAEFGAVSGNHTPRVPPTRTRWYARIGFANPSSAAWVSRSAMPPWPWPGDGRSGCSRPGRRAGAGPAAFTHDLDIVAWWPLFTLSRLVELTRHRAPGRALRALAAAVGSLLRNPVWAGVRQLLALEAGAGVRSTWFVLCARRPSPRCGPGT